MKVTDIVAKIAEPVVKQHGCELCFNNFIYLFLATLGFCCCTGFSLAVECGLLLVVASFVAEHGLQVSRASEVVARGL